MSETDRILEVTQYGSSLHHLDIQKSVRPDGIHPRTLTELAQVLEQDTFCHLSAALAIQGGPS